MAETSFFEKKILLFYGAWWLLVIVMQFLILNHSGYDSYHSAIDAAASGTLLGALCYLLSNNMRFYLPEKEKYWYLLISGVLVTALWLGMLWALLTALFAAGDTYLLFFKSYLWVRFGTGFLLATSMIMYSLMIYSEKAQKESEARQAETEKLNREAELFKLRQQLNPHFLFNSLNSINSLIISNPEKARTMVHQLSDFLRGMLKKDEEKMISLEEELQYLSLYLEIEKVRFGHRLQTNIQSDAEARKCLVPPLILQPVVENAIKFGLYDTTGIVNIQLSATIHTEGLLLSVTNPYDPETANPSKGTGFGITSISRRLFLLFLRSNLVNTRTENSTFITTLLIPQS